MIFTRFSKGELLKRCKMESKVHALEQLYFDVIEERDHGLSRTEFHNLLHETLLSQRRKHPARNKQISKRSIMKDVTSMSATNCDNKFTDHLSEGEKGLIPQVINMHDVQGMNIESDGDSGHVTQGTQVTEQVIVLSERTKSGPRITDLCPDTGQKMCLLMLTCLRAVLQSEIDKGKTSVVNSSLIEEMVETDILSVLLDFLNDKDKFISYAASKALITAVRCDRFNMRKKSLIQDILVRVTEGSATGAPFLNILKHFMSNTSGEQTNSWCFQTLKSSLVFRTDFVKPILECIEMKSIDKPVTLLTLLQKCVKYVNKLDKDVKQELLSAMFCPLQEELLTFLVTCLHSIDLPPWRILCKKTLDIFNTFLTYGCLLAQMKEMPILYFQTACRILSGICPSVLLSMPYVRQYVGFGGSKFEGVRIENQNGDLGFLRKLFLLLLRSCATLLRTKTASLEDRERVATCLSSLQQFMTKTFPSSGVGFQWLPLVFGDQDDSWVEALLCLLDVYLHLPRVPASSMICSQTSPHAVFLQFLESSSNDHMVLVDLLTSPETCFLLYLLRYLKCVAAEWGQFTSACHSAFPHGQSCSNNMEDVESLDNDSRDVSGKSKVVSSPEESVDVDNATKNYSSVAKKIKLTSPFKDEKQKTLSSNDGQNEDDGASVVASQGCGGLACLNVYSDSDSCPEDDYSPAGQVSSESVSVMTGLHSKTSANQERFDHKLLKKKFMPKCDKTLDTNVLLDSEQTSVCSIDTVPSDLSLRHSHLPQDGSCMSCDLQCVETVMSTLIRVRLRIERLSEQDLFPYNPDPLLTLLEHCETLYEQMDSLHGQLQ